jgi:plasmid stabilization system protein ParE
VRLVLTDPAKADIRKILRDTRAQFGPHQVPKYRALIVEARTRMREKSEPWPSSGRIAAGLASVSHLSARKTRPPLLPVRGEPQ